MVTLYHGTNVVILDGLASGTYMTEDIEVAKEYACNKRGNRIYQFTGDRRHFYKDIFDEHYIAAHFIPLSELQLRVW